MKNCKKCEIDKSVENFHVDKTSKDGLFRWCKTCKKEYDKRYRKSDKVKNFQKSKSYRDRKKEYQKVRFDSDPRLILLQAAKARAKKYNLPFNITIEDIIIPEKCPLLNISLERKPYGKKTGFLMNSPSLDKIESRLGYTKGNVMVISMKANAMKYSATLDELETFCKNSLKLITNVRSNNSKNMDHSDDDRTID